MRDFKNNAAVASNYKKLDTNPDHYKGGVGYGRPYHPHQSEGVVLHLIDGSTFKTKEYTAEDIQAQLTDSERQWLQLDNGGAVNLKCVVRFEPMRQEYRARRDW